MKSETAAQTAQYKAEADAAKAKWDKLTPAEKQAVRKSAWQKKRAELDGMEAVGRGTTRTSSRTSRFRRAGIKRRRSCGSQPSSTRHRRDLAEGRATANRAPCDRIACHQAARRATHNRARLHQALGGSFEAAPPTTASAPDRAEHGKGAAVS